MPQEKTDKRARDALDEEVLQAIRRGHTKFWSIEDSVRGGYRQVDRSLQRLRSKGLIRFTSGNWTSSDLPPATRRW